jgi:hypothetical protein
MRRLMIAIVLLSAVGLQGCAMSEVVQSIFGAKNSDDAAMNRTNRKNDTLGL